MADVDDGLIGNDAGLLRRIHPCQVVPDHNAGGEMRPSSAAFKDLELSVDVEPILADAGFDWKFSLRDRPEYSLVRFQAHAAREKRLLVVHEPVDRNSAHAKVVGKKTQGIANHLRDNSGWVHLILKAGSPGAGNA